MEVIKVILNQGWVGSIIGLVGLIVAFILYRASKTISRPCFQTQAIRLIGREDQALPNDVEIYYKGKKVERLTKVNIVFWNSGKATIDGKNIIVDDPLRFEISEGEQILSANVLKLTRDCTKFKAYVNPKELNQLICTFEYLDPDDGAVIEILHTDAKKYPQEKGIIKGIPKGLLDMGPIIALNNRNYIAKGLNVFPLKLIYRKSFLYLVISVSGIILLTGIFYKMLNIPFLMEILGNDSSVPMIIGGCLYIIPTCFLLWMLRKKFPKKLNIDGFN